MGVLAPLRLVATLALRKPRSVAAARPAALVVVATALHRQSTTATDPRRHATHTTATDRLRRVTTRTTGTHARRLVTTRPVTTRLATTHPVAHPVVATAVHRRRAASRRPRAEVATTTFPRRHRAGAATTTSRLRHVDGTMSRRRAVTELQTWPENPTPTPAAGRCSE